MEVPLQQVKKLADTIKEDCFNPCFNGSSSSTDVYSIGCYIHIVVSILVLMEVPLQQRTLKKGGFKMLGFNPCFNGSSSSTNMKF